MLNNINFSWSKISFLLIRKKNKICFAEANVSEILVYIIEIPVSEIPVSEVPVSEIPVSGICSRCYVIFPHESTRKARHDNLFKTTNSLDTFSPVDPCVWNPCVWFLRYAMVIFPHEAPRRARRDNLFKSTNSFAYILSSRSLCLKSLCLVFALYAMVIFPQEAPRKFFSAGSKGLQRWPLQINKFFVHS